MSEGHIRNVVVISDLHGGCRFGLCPPERVVLDGGIMCPVSDTQRIVWGWWIEFWDVWVPEVCHGEPYAVVVNGDTTDGRHHGSTTQVSQNLSDQKLIALEILRSIRERAARLFIVRGTEAHVGPSAEIEEDLARELKADRAPEGNYSRFELRLRVGEGLVQCMHHIGTTGSMHYESTAVMKELTEAYAEAGRWDREPPDVVVRSHRHRHLEIRVPTKLGYGISFVTAGWQLKTPFVYRIPGGRLTTPQFGGSVIRQGDQDLYTRHKIWSIDPPREEVL